MLANEYLAENLKNKCIEKLIAKLDGMWYIQNSFEVPNF